MFFKLSALTLTLTIYFWMEARMQYNCLYKQITYLNKIMNLPIAKQRTKIKEQKETVSNSWKYYVIFLTYLI